MSKRRIQPLGGGRHRVEIPADERHLLADLARQMRTLLTQDGTGELTKRLYPTAYADDAERDAEFKALMSDDLLAGRLHSADVLEESAEATELDDEQLMGWIAAVNDLRLVLGTRLDVSEDENPEDRAGEPGYAVYHYLGWLLEHLMDCARSTLPDVSDDGMAPG